MALHVEYQHDGLSGTFTEWVTVPTYVYLTPLFAVALAALGTLGWTFGAQALIPVGLLCLTGLISAATAHGSLGGVNLWLLEEVVAVAPQWARTRRLEARGHWLEVGSGDRQSRVYLPGCSVRVQRHTVWVHAALTDQTISISAGPSDGDAVERLAEALQRASRVEVGHADDVPLDLRALQAQGALGGRSPSSTAR